VDGAISIKDRGLIAGTDVKRIIRVCGFTTPILGPNGKPLPKDAVHMDVRVVGGNATEMRARPRVDAGSRIEIVVQVPPSFGVDRTMAAIDAAGSNIGLCEWRPDKGGEYGTFEVTALHPREVPRILAACDVEEEPLRLSPQMLRARHDGDSPEPQPLRKVKAVANHLNNQRANGVS
jgi:hypothetical protein